MKDLEAKDSAQPGGGGATGIFGTLAEEVPKGTAVAVPVTSVFAAEPPVSDPGLGTGSGMGFTQLLRTLSLHEPLGGPVPEAPRGSGAESAPVFSSVAPSQPSAAAAVPNAGGLTQMFEAGQPQWAASAIPSVVVPSAAAQGAPTQASRPVGRGFPAAPVGTSPAGGGGFTQLFQALDSPAPPRASDAVAAPTTPQLAAEPFAATPSRPLTAGPVSSLNAPSGGFTALFRSLENEASESPSASAAAPIAPPVPAAAQSSVAAPAAVLAAQPSTPAPSAGGITQLLRAIDLGSLGPAKASGEAATTAPLPAPTATPVAAIPTAASAASAPLPTAPEVIPEAMPSTMSVPMISTIVPSTVPPSAAVEGSSLTGMFAPASFLVAAAPVAAVPVSAKEVIPVSPSGSSLTGIFSSAAPSVPVSAPIPPAAAPAAPPMRAAAATGSGSEAGGSFTQLFRSLDRSAESAFPAANASPASEQSQGSFTKFFSSASMQPAREASQADSFPPLPSSGGATRAEYGSGPSGFGESKGWEEPRFSTPPAARPAPSAPSYSAPSYPEPQPRMPEPPAASASGGGVGSGGLTQLLRTLDGPASSPVSTSPARVEGAFGPPQPAPRMDPVFDVPAAGSSGATRAFRLPQGLSTPAAPATPAGPGEFTRIIQASALRESARQGGGAPGAAGPVPPAANAPAAGSAGFSVSSSGMPTMPAAPTMPAMPTMGGGGGGGGFAMPQMPMAPAMPSVPNLTVTAPATPSAAAGGGSKLLPILLVVVVVLLIAVLLAVVLMMKH